MQLQDPAFARYVHEANKEASGVSLVKQHARFSPYYLPAQGFMHPARQEFMEGSVQPSLNLWWRDSPSLTAAFRRRLGEAKSFEAAHADHREPMGFRYGQTMGGGGKGNTARLERSRSDPPFFCLAPQMSLPPITPELAGQMVDKAIAALEDAETKKKVEDILTKAKEAEPEDQVKRQTLMMQEPPSWCENPPSAEPKLSEELLPLAKSVVGDSWKDWGVTEDNAMMVMMQFHPEQDPPGHPTGHQVQMMAMMDPVLQPKAAKVMSFFQGQRAARDAAAVRGVAAVAALGEAGRLIFEES
eukprot:g3723.t1